MSNAENIRTEIIAYLKEKNGKLVRRKDLIAAIKSKGYTVGSIRGVLYRYTNEGKNIENVRVIRKNGSVYYYYNNNDLDVLRIEIDRFIGIIKSLGINFNTNSYSSVDSYYIAKYGQIFIDLLKIRIQDKDARKKDQNK